MIIILRALCCCAFLVLVLIIRDRVDVVMVNITQMSGVQSFFFVSHSLGLPGSIVCPGGVMLEAVGDDYQFLSSLCNFCKCSFKVRKS